jgi:hypothetical protein
MVGNKRKLRKPTKEVRLERFREQERNRLVKDAAPPPLPKSGVMAGGVADPHYLALVARARAPLERGTYEQVVTDAKRYAALLQRTISVGDIDTDAGFDDEDGFTELSTLEIELLCPHANATDSLSYVRYSRVNGTAVEGSNWEHEETGTDAWFDNCRCPGVTL